MQHTLLCQVEVEKYVPAVVLEPCTQSNSTKLVNETL